MAGVTVIPVMPQEVLGIGPKIPAPGILALQDHRDL